MPLFRHCKKIGEGSNIPSPYIMTILILILICGINLAPFLLPQLDIWHAQGIFSQIVILALFSASFIKSPVYREPKNIELGILHLWVGSLTAIICFISQTHGKYDITHFFPYFNFLCILILYKTIVQYLNRIDVEICLLAFKYMIIATLLMCVLQFFGTSQFFKLFYPGDRFHNNPVVGFIGNGTHLSGFLGMMVPVFLYFGKREDWLCLVLMGILLCFAGTSTGDPSISGWIVAIGIGIYWLYSLNKINLWHIVTGTIILIIGLTTFWDFISSLQIFNLNGRNGFILNYWPIIKEWFLTGAGPGTMNAIYKQTANPNVRHLHMEYIQFILEIGIIGLMCVIAVIRKAFIIRCKDKQMLTVKCIFLGFCLSACFNYPMHLWLPAIYAAIAYGLFMVLHRGDSHARINPQAN